jgi:hypothetical protein
VRFHRITLPAVALEGLIEVLVIDRTTFKPKAYLKEGYPYSQTCAGFSC